MNYFAHALPFLAAASAARADETPAAYFIAGTATPDWLVVADRPLRVRSKHVEPFLADADPLTAAVAGGMLQHFRDDAHFHATRAFVELSLQCTATARDVLAGDPGFRPSFLGHILVELLLDATLTAAAPESARRYFEVLDAVDPTRVQDAVSRIGPRPTARLAPLIVAFCRERILWDYLEDAKLLGRLNQVMRRVGLAELPDRFADILPELRRRVADRQRELLDGLPAALGRQSNQPSPISTVYRRPLRCDSE